MDNARDLYQRVGMRLRQARQLRGLTQFDLAQMVGMSRASIANIESGRQRLMLHTLWKLAEALQMDARQLLPQPSEKVPYIPVDLEVKAPPDISDEEVRNLIAATLADNNDTE